MLDEAMAARVVSDVPGAPGRLRFAHVLIRDTLYDGLTTARRVAAAPAGGRGARGALRRRAGPHLAELAHHAIAGSDFEKGLRYARARRRPRARAARLRGGRAPVRDGARRARRPRRRADALRAAALARRGADSGGKHSGREEGLPRRGRRSRGASACTASSPAPRRATAGGSCGAGRRRRPARAATRGGTRRARRRRRRAPRQASRPTRRSASRRALARPPRHAEPGGGRARPPQPGTPAALAYALDGRAAAIVAPDTVAECLALGTSSREVAERIGDTERIVHGHFTGSSRRSRPGTSTRSQADLEADEPHRRRAPTARSALAGSRCAGDARARGGQARRRRGTHRQSARARRARAARRRRSPSTGSSATRSATSGAASRRSSRRSATWSSELSGAPGLPLRARSSPRPARTDGRRRSERSTTWRATTSRLCPSIRSGSTA